MLDADAQTTLNDLRWHWEDAYRIDQPGRCLDGRAADGPVRDDHGGQLDGAADQDQVRLRQKTLGTIMKAPGLILGHCGRRSTRWIGL